MFARLQTFFFLTLFAFGLICTNAHAECNNPSCYPYWEQSPENKIDGGLKIAHNLFKIRNAAVLIKLNEHNNASENNHNNENKNNNNEIMAEQIIKLIDEIFVTLVQQDCCDNLTE